MHSAIHSRNGIPNPIYFHIFPQDLDTTEAVTGTMTVTGLRIGTNAPGNEPQVPVVQDAAGNQRGGMGIETMEATRTAKCMATQYVLTPLVGYRNSNIIGVKRDMHVFP